MGDRVTSAALRCSRFVVRPVMSEKGCQAVAERRATLVEPQLGRGMEGNFCFSRNVFQQTKPLEVFLFFILHIHIYDKFYFCRKSNCDSQLLKPYIKLLELLLLLLLLKACQSLSPVSNAICWRTKLNKAASCRARQCGRSSS